MLCLFFSFIHSKQTGLPIRDLSFLKVAHCTHWCAEGEEQTGRWPRVSKTRWASKEWNCKNKLEQDYFPII